MDDERLVELRAAVAAAAEALEAAESAVDAAAGDGVALKNEWRSLVVSADVDGDPDAVRRLAELEQQMSVATLDRERAEIIRSEWQNRLRAAESAVDAYIIEGRPMRYFKRRPGGNELFGPLTNWAMGLAGRVPAGDAAGAWVECTQDRALYELRRESHYINGDWRLLRNGGIVKLYTVELKAEPA